MTARARNRRWAVRAAVHGAVAVATTFPLVAHLGDRIAIGREPAATVPFFNLWSLTWTAQRLPHLLHGWWDAPIFWPARGTYASSELQPLTGLAFALLRPLTGPVAAYGVILLLALVANGLAAGLLARRLGASEGASLAAGVLAQTVPFLFAQLGVLQLLMLWPVLLTLDRLVAWAASGRLRDAAGIGAGVAVTYLTCGYFAVLLVLCALLVSPLLVERAWFAEWRHRLAGVVVAVACAAPLVPFALGQQRRLDDVRWTDATIRLNSASWSSLAPGGSDFAGFALVFLGLAGAVAARRRPAARFLLGLAVVATIAALGLRLELAGWRPYGVLVDHVAAFSHLRSPFRAIALAQISLAVLAGLGIDALWSSRDRTIGPVVVGDGDGARAGGHRRRAGPPPTAAGPHHAPGSRGWTNTPAARWWPCPPPRVTTRRTSRPRTAAMVQALEHGHPLVNGYSGFFPDRDEGLRAWPPAVPRSAGGQRAPRPRGCLRGRRSELVDRPAGRRRPLPRRSGSSRRTRRASSSTCALVDGTTSFGS